MKSSTRDEAEGRVHNVRGSIKEAVGKVIGNRKLRRKGKAEKRAGKAQAKVGQVKRVLGR
ncbi:MAG: CsbD family protein [bacterium]